MVIYENSTDEKTITGSSSADRIENEGEDVVIYGIS